MEDGEQNCEGTSYSTVSSKYLQNFGKNPYRMENKIARGHHFQRYQVSICKILANIYEGGVIMLNGIK
jgi:hypothetical protein